ncbi:response regulator transcription factor [Bacillus sp. BHET2]|uniref:response regulator transcription factor n=1 Tax=Bacillus sp. BHET2 TaxID=2583818 RepID=UPI00110D80D0|nr:response regulator transcription factor [Bacillus sp. BHET2]TMU87200.1 response regulator transcription factor [Bacillus sp. BHET2]
MDVLVVEDNKSVTSMLEMFFIKEGIDGEFVHDGSEGYRRYREKDWDLVILDWMLPGMDGVTICKKIRESGSKVPVIMLTAKDSESDQVLGLELGADDYVTKPFSPLALMARIRAVSRRYQGEKASAPGTRDVSTSDFQISKETREVFLKGAPLTNLTPKEFELLYYLSQHPRHVFSREQLLERVWGYDFYGDERTVDVHIKRLRNKIGSKDKPYLHTVWGVGYKFDEAAGDEI